MSILRVHLFGQPKGGFDDMTALPALGSTSLTLLVYLLLKPGQVHRREDLCTLLWGERPDHNARACLNTTLWRLRRGLRLSAEGGDRYVVAPANSDLSFNWKREHWVDVHAFEHIALHFLTIAVDSLSKADVDTMKSGMALVDGELLEGFYNDWALRERERLRLLFLDCAIHLMHYFCHHETLTESLTFANLVLRHDPLRENVHREVMRMYWRLGDRSRAVQQYQRCCATLDEELGVGPMPETRKLYERIVVSTELDAAPADAVPPLRRETLPSTVMLDDILQQLRQAVHDLDQARSALAHVSQQLEHV